MGFNSNASRETMSNLAIKHLGFVKDDIKSLRAKIQFLSLRVSKLEQSASKSKKT